MKSGVPGNGVRIAKRGRSMCDSIANCAVSIEDVGRVVIEAEDEAALDARCRARAELSITSCSRRAR